MGLFLGYAILQLPDFIAAIIAWLKNGYYRRANRHARVDPEQGLVVLESESVTSNTSEIEKSANKYFDECNTRFEKILNDIYQEFEEFKCNVRFEEKLNVLLKIIN